MADFDGPVGKVAQRYQGERACAQLLGLITGITADGHLHDLEIQFLRTWLAENHRAGEHWVGEQIATQIDHVLADGQVSDDERASLLKALQGVTGVAFPETGCVTPDVIAFPADECDVILKDAVVCLTGQFHFGKRPECEAVTAAAGATCVGSITKKVSYLVIGSAGATTSWKQASYGNKIDDAMKLKEKGHRIAILTEERWRSGLAASV